MPLRRPTDRVPMEALRQTHSQETLWASRGVGGTVFASNLPTTFEVGTSAALPLSPAADGRVSQQDNMAVSS